jgi:hypothetical protein
LLSDLHVGLWRDKTGASFPYPVGADVSVTGWANAAGKGGTEYYYFFYDWDIELGGASCTSERAKVDLVTSTEDNLLGEIAIYPNPANSYINIDNLSAENCIINIYNSNMQQIKSTQSNGSNNVKVDFKELASGVYFCRITSESRVLLTKKIVIIK